MNLDALHLVDNSVLQQTRAETTTLYKVDLGNGVVLHYGELECRPTWIVENQAGSLSIVLHDDT